LPLERDELIKLVEKEYRFFQSKKITIDKYLDMIKIR
jgi:hypothetical protein